MRALFRRRPVVEIVKRSKRGEKTVNMRELMRDLTVTDGPDEVTAVVTTAAGNNNMSPEYLTRAIRQYLPQYEIPFSAYHRMNVFTSDGTPFRDKKGESFMATRIAEEQLQSQFTYIDAVARLLGDKRPKAYTHTFGCQQNEADTERIRGMLSEMGYEMTDTPDAADFILFNTCAVREHAEDRAFGNIGALRHLKKSAGHCYCVVRLHGPAAERSNVEKIKKSYLGCRNLAVRHACALAISVIAVPRADRENAYLTSAARTISPKRLPVLRWRKGVAVHHKAAANNFCTSLHRTVCARQRSAAADRRRSRKNCVSWSRAGYRLRCRGQNVNPRQGPRH